MTNAMDKRKNKACKQPKKEARAIDLKNILTLFKAGKSSGETCFVNHARNSASLETVRVVLRDAGGYEERMPTPPAKVGVHA